MTPDKIILTTLKHEGGISNHKADRGGLTNFGITFRTLKSFIPAATEESLINMTKEQAIAFYRTYFFYGMGVDKYPKEIQDIMFDMNVNHGVGNSTRILQRALVLSGMPVTVDGIPGRQTLSAAQKVNLKTLRDNLITARLRFFQAIVRNDPSQAVFARGWENRAKSFETV
jgi:lysozyme family protein